MEAGAWVPAFAGMTGGGDDGLVRVAAYVYGKAYFRVNDGIMGYGDGGLGPRFRGDDGVGLGMTGWWG